MSDYPAGMLNVEAKKQGSLYRASVDAKYRNTGQSVQEALAARRDAEDQAETARPRFGADPYFLPGVKMTVDGVEYPAVELRWILGYSCGCAYGSAMVTEESITENAAWLMLCDDSRKLVVQRQKRGDTMKLRPWSDVDWLHADCTHQAVTS